MSALLDSYLQMSGELNLIKLSVLAQLSSLRLMVLTC